MTIDPHPSGARAEATPRPWTAYRDEWGEIRSIAGEVEGQQETILIAPHVHFLGDIEGQRRWQRLGEANIELAVRCVNAHATLVAALEHALAYFEMDGVDGAAVVEQARAALQQARGEDE